MAKALHFCYGIGAFVSPMIAEPFLLNEDCSPFIDNDTSAILTAAADLRLLAPPGTIPINDTNLPADTLYEAQQMTRVRFAFWIMAAVQVVHIYIRVSTYAHGCITDLACAHPVRLSVRLSVRSYTCRDGQEILLDCVQSNVLLARIIFSYILLSAFSFLSTCIRDLASI